MTNKERWWRSGVRFFFFLFLAAIIVRGVFGATLHEIDYTTPKAAYVSYEYDYTPNNTLIVNTTFCAAGGAPYTGADGYVWATFYYNDTSQNRTTKHYYSGSSWQCFTEINPFPTKKVDRILWEGAHVDDYGLYLRVDDAWLDTFTPTLTVSVVDDVTGGIIQGLCVDFTVAVPGVNDSTCTPATTQTYPVASTDLCGSSETCANLLSEMNNATWSDIVDADFASNGGLAAVRQYTTEGTCTGTLCEDQLHNGDGQCPTLSIAGNQFCIVTDQLAAVLINHAMGENQARYEALHNMTELLRHPTPNNLQCWRAYINGTKTYDSYDDACVTSDSASDASIAILWAHSISCAKQRAGTWTNTSVDYCADYDEQGKAIWGLSSDHGEIQYLASGRAFLCNGYNNQASCPTATESFRPDYYLLSPLMDYAEWTQNTSMQADVLEFLDAYNLSLGDNHIHEDKTGHFDSTGLIYDPDDVLTPPYMDNIDTWRAYMWVSSFWNQHQDRINQTYNTSIYDYWWTHYGGGNASLPASGALPIEIYSNSTGGGVKYTEASYKGIAMHLPLAVQKNSTYAGELMTSLADTYWTGTQYSGAAYMGGYFSQYATMSIGHLTGMIDPNQWSSDLCEITDPPHYKQAGLEIQLNNPENGSTQVETTAILNITVYNNNVTPGVSDSNLVANYSSETDFSSYWSGYTLTGSDAYGDWMNFSQGDTATTPSGLTFLNESAQNYTVNITFNHTLANYTKFFVKSVGGQAVGPRWMLENTNDGTDRYNLKHDGNNYSSVGTFNTSLDILTLQIFVDVTTQQSTATLYNETDGTILGTPQSDPWFNYSTTTGGNASAIEAGTYNPGADLKVYDWVIWNGTGPAGDGSAGGPETMNVSFYNASDNTLLSTTNNLNNATSANHTLTSLPNTTITWYAVVTSENNNETFPTFTVTINTGVGTSANFCNETSESISYNVTGTYNITAYSLGHGDNTEGLYYNATRESYVFNNQSNEVKLNLTTYQALLNITALQLWTNTTILAWNATNNKATNTTTSGGLLLKASQGTNKVKIDVAGNYSRNYTFTINTPLTTRVVNATNIYDTLIILNATTIVTNTIVSAFNTSLTNESLINNTQNQTNTGSITYQALRGYAYDINITADNYADENTTITTDEPIEYYTFNLYTTNTITMQFYDEITNALINTTNITVNLLSDVLNKNYTTQNGSVYADLLIPANYTIRYDAPGYLGRTYVFELLDNTVNYLNLTLLDENNGTEVTITVKNGQDDTVEGAIVKILKEDYTGSLYTQIASGQTNFQGQTVQAFMLNGPLYKFIVTLDGVVVLSTQATQVYGTTLTLVIADTGNEGFKSAVDRQSLAGTLTYNNATNTFTFTYTDGTLSASETCLNVYEMSENKQLYNQTCTSSASGSLLASVKPRNGTYYLAEGVVTIESINHVVDTLYANFGDYIPETGSGLLMLFLMMIVFVFTMMASIEIAVAATSFVPLMFTIIGLTNLGLTVAVSVFALGLFLAFLLGVVKRG